MAKWLKWLLPSVIRVQPCGVRHGCTTKRTQKIVHIIHVTKIPGLLDFGRGYVECPAETEAKNSNDTKDVEPKIKPLCLRGHACFISRWYRFCLTKTQWPKKNLKMPGRLKRKPKSHSHHQACWVWHQPLIVVPCSQNSQAPHWPVLPHVPVYLSTRNRLTLDPLYICALLLTLIGQLELSS